MRARANNVPLLPLFWLLVSNAVGVSAQTIVDSARIMCDGGNIAGAIINQTNDAITDVEVELSIFTRDKKGIIKRQRDARFVVVPSLNQTGMVTKLDPNGNVYFDIPGKYNDNTCKVWYGNSLVLNVAAIAITRVNGKSLLTVGKDGPQKQAPLEAMLQLRRETPERMPTQSEVIEAIRRQNALLRSSIINNQLQDCRSRGTWACTFNNDTNINVVISQQ